MTFVDGWIVLHPEGQIVLVHAEDGRTLAFPHDPRGDLAPSPEGNGIWVFDRVRRVVERFALPR